MNKAQHLIPIFQIYTKYDLTVLSQTDQVPLLLCDIVLVRPEILPLPDFVPRILPCPPPSTRTPPLSLLPSENLDLSPSKASPFLSQEMAKCVQV